VAETYLTPEDVGPLAARRVLDFLNRAQDAQEIADRIDIPGEPDIGVTVGQHLIDARDALGGFTDLHQVAAGRDAPQSERLAAVPRRALAHHGSPPAQPGDAGALGRDDRQVDVGRPVPGRVEHQRATGAVEHHVLGLEVAVHHAARVRFPKGR